MILSLSLLALTQAQDGDLVALALRYLARHQSENGSWGRRSGVCACPDEPAPETEPLDAPGRARVAALIDELDAEDAERRLRAQRDLVREGWAAMPALREAGGSPERRARAADVLREIRRSGTREDLELTAWAVLSFLGAGYSHLSRDEADGRVMGQVVHNGLAWILSKADEKGAFAEGHASAHAVAALAVNEAYGLTMSGLFEAPARKAVEVVVANPAKDARTLAWQVMALKSAELAGFAFPASAYGDRRSDMKRRRSEEPASLFLQAAQTMAAIFIDKSRTAVDLGDLPGSDPARMDIETAYLASLALFQYDGPGGKVWKRFREVEKNWILPAQIEDRGRCARGAWAATGTAARLKFACHGALINEYYFSLPLEK